MSVSSTVVSTRIRRPAVTRLSRAICTSRSILRREVAKRFSTDLEDELSPEMARLAQAMSIGSLGQAIELDLGSAHHTRLIQLGNTFHMPAGASNGRSQRYHISTLWF